jgi:hypothetical protein
VVACTVPDEPSDEDEDDDEEPPPTDEPDELPVPEPELLDPELAALEPDVALLPAPELADEPELVVLAACAEPGRVAATTPAASTLATPTPVVTAVSRRFPRRLSADGGNGRGADGGSGWPPGLLDIGGSLLPTRC